MATVARQEKKRVKQKRIDLTPTGLLMEGDCTTYRVAGETGIFH
jgi:hypothetical protein